MQAKKNYDEMFLGGLVDRAKSFAEKNPLATKAIGLGGGMLLNKAIGNKGGGLLSKMSGIGLMGMLGKKLRDRRNANATASAAANTRAAVTPPDAVRKPGADATVMDIAQAVPQAEYGAMVKKYRKGGMFYADQGDIFQEEKGKNKTSEPPGMDRVRRALGLTGSDMFFGAFPQSEVEEETSSTGMRAVKGKPGSNMLPEVEIVGTREQPQEEKKEFKLIEGDPNEMVRVLGKDGKAVSMTRAQLNQRRINKFNEENPDAKVKNILSKEEEFGYEPPEVMQLPLSPDRLLQKYMLGQLDDAYKNSPNTRRIVDQAMKEYEARGGKFRDGLDRGNLFYEPADFHRQIYQPGYGFSEEELAEMIPRYAAIAKEQGKVLPPGFERFLTEE